MAIYPIDIDFELTGDRLIDLFIFQWHTPLPNNWAKIAANVAQDKGQLLRNFRDWLVQYFDSSQPSRPLFILAPELSMPLFHDSIISEMMNQLRRPAVIIAGLEYLLWTDYRQLIENLSDMPEKEKWLEGGIDSHMVNAAGIWIREAGGSIKRFIQPKRKPYEQEHPVIFPGHNVLLFRSRNQIGGARLNFCIQVCSDFSSANFVRAMREECATVCPSLSLDMTFLLQCNKDQDAIQFKQATQAYFEEPINKLETDAGCLVFVNNANEVLGKTQSWGRSKLHFRYHWRWRPLDFPYQTYWLWDEPAHDHQAVILRESGPSLYWLRYKPAYLVPRIAGSGQPGPFPKDGALYAVIQNNGFGQQNGLNCFAPILPIHHWLNGEWIEGKNELKSSLSANNVEQTVVNSFVGSYENVTIEWLQAIGQRDGVAKTALSVYFELWKRDYFPPREAEPQKWSLDTSKAVKQMLRIYALLKLGQSVFPGGSIDVNLKGAHHASATEELRITVIWGGGEYFPRSMISAYLAARETYGVPDLLARSCLLVLVDPAATPPKATLLGDNYENQLSSIVEGTPPLNPPEHLQLAGEVVRSKSAKSLKLLYDTELLNEVGLAESNTNLTQRLAEAIAAGLS